MTTHKNDYLIGISAALGYSIISAISRLFVENVGQQLDPLLPLVFGLLFAMVCFHLCNIGKWSRIYQKITQHKKTWCYVMITTAIVWSSFYLGPHYIGADDYTILVFAINGLIGVYYLNITHKQNIFFNGIVCFIYILACGLCIANAPLTYHRLLGLAFALASGMSLYIFMKFSSELQIKTGLSSTATLAVRWWLGLIILLIFSFPQLGQLAHQSADIYWQMFFAAFLGIVCPAYLVQKAAIYIGAKLSAVVQSTTPFFTVMIGAMFHVRHFSMLDVIASFCIIGAILLLQFPKFFYIKKRG